MSTKLLQDAWNNLGLIFTVMLWHSEF